MLLVYYIEQYLYNEDDNRKIVSRTADDPTYLNVMHYNIEVDQ